MDNIILPNKGTTETLPFTVNFSDRFVYGEAINGIAVSISVVSGIDSSANLMISTPATYTANTITQVVSGGVAGVTYMLVYLCTGTASHNYVKQGYLTVVAPAAY